MINLNDLFSFLQELVVVDAKPRDWKGIFISLLVISR